MKTSPTLCPSTDPCPTGVYSIDLAEMRHLPVATWMAMNRHQEAALGRPGLASVFEQALADIEISGLLKQAEKSLALHNKAKPARQRGDTRFPGITRHARILGVNRVTLYRVLEGKWHLPGLKSRYDALIASEAAMSGAN
jgi:hypothetical protein